MCLKTFLFRKIHFKQGCQSGKSQEKKTLSPSLSGGAWVGVRGLQSVSSYVVFKKGYIPRKPGNWLFLVIGRKQSWSRSFGKQWIP
jgi:hypothetical protein